MDKTCIKCGNSFRITPEDLEFYNKMKVPIPRNCPDCRHKERIKFRNPHKLWDRQCEKCHEQIKTTFAEGCQEKIYCEKCYLEELA